MLLLILTLCRVIASFLVTFVLLTREISHVTFFVRCHICDFLADIVNFWLFLYYSLLYFSHPKNIEGLLDSLITEAEQEP